MPTPAQPRPLPDTAQVLAAGIAAELRAWLAQHPLQPGQAVLVPTADGWQHAVYLGEGTLPISGRTTGLLARVRVAGAPGPALQVPSAQVVAA